MLQSHNVRTGTCRGAQAFFFVVVGGALAIEDGGNTMMVDQVGCCVAQLLGFLPCAGSRDLTGPHTVSVRRLQRNGGLTDGPDLMLVWLKPPHTWRLCSCNPLPRGLPVATNHTSRCWHGSVVR